MIARSERMSEADRLASDVEAAKLVKALHDFATTILRRLRPSTQETAHVIGCPDQPGGEQA